MAKATVNGQVVGYTFEWFEGGVSGTPFYIGSEAFGLSDVLYTVRATDVVSGCENTATITISNDFTRWPRRR